MHGGAGADTLESGQTLTTIGDFTDGEDQIDLSNISGITAFSDLTITDDDGTAMIDLSSQGAGTIRLTGVATTTWTPTTSCLPNRPPRSMQHVAT